MKPEKKLLMMAKEARDNKNYELEKFYLESVLSVDENNIKAIHGLVKNARKRRDIKELEIWLDKLVLIKPTGEVLEELIRIVHSKGDINRERELLLKRKEIEPDNKKVKKKLHIVEKNRRPVFLIENEIYELIQKARNIIYSEIGFNEKEEQILKLMEGLDEQVIICIIVELYKSSCFKDRAVNLLKKYRREINIEMERDKLKLINRLIELVKSSKTRPSDFEYFWNATWGVNKKKLKNKVD